MDDISNALGVSGNPDDKQPLQNSGTPKVSHYSTVGDVNGLVSKSQGR